MYLFCKFEIISVIIAKNKEHEFQCDSDPSLNSKSDIYHPGDCGGVNYHELWFSYLITNSGPAWSSQMALVVKNLPANTGDVRDAGSVLCLDDPLEEGTATHSSILVWTEKPGGLQSMDCRVGHKELDMPEAT